MSLDTSSHYMDRHAKQAFPSAVSEGMRSFRSAACICSSTMIGSYRDDTSEDTAALLRQLETSNPSPPAATSTPLKNQASIQMPSIVSQSSRLVPYVRLSSVLTTCQTFWNKIQKCIALWMAWIVSTEMVSRVGHLVSDVMKRLSCCLPLAQRLSLRCALRMAHRSPLNDQHWCPIDIRSTKGL